MTSLLEMPERIGAKKSAPTKSAVFCAGVLRYILLAAVVLLGGRSAWSQGITGSITGTVTDSSGATVSGAAVTVRELETNATRTVTTSDVGSYTVPQLPAGHYEVKFEKGGFGTVEHGNITLTIDQVAQIDATLSIGSQQQTVSVTSEAPVIQTESSSVGLLVDSTTIQNTPLNGHLSIIGLLSLAPGVQGLSPTAQDTVPDRGVTFAVGSAQRNSYGGVGFTLDGVANMQVSLQRGEGEVPPLDAIAEFKVLTSGGAAEFGQPAQVIVVSKGGQNQLHGEALEYNRGRGTAAKSYFAGAQPRPPYQRNEYGGNISGPIYIPKLYNGRNRSFFLFAFEGYHLTQAASVNSQQPTALERSGNFTEFSSPIVDPSTGNPFQGNIISSARFSKVDSQLLNLLYPLPTTSGTGTNTFELIPFVDDVTRYSVRIDHKINEKNQFRFTFLRAFYGPNPDVGTSSLAGGMSQDGEHNVNSIIGWTHTFSPTLILDAYASYLHLPIYRTPQNYKTDFASIIPGLGPQLIPGAPSITITNITSISEAGSKNLEQDYQANVALTKVLAHHTIKTGFSYLFDNSWGNTAQGHGTFQFNGRYTGNAFADFLLGYPSQTGTSTPSSFITRNLSSQYGMYIQDDYRILPNLTLNVGIRYDLQWFGNSHYGQEALYVPSVQKVVVFAKAYPSTVIPAFLPDTVLAPSVGLPVHMMDYIGQDTNNVAPRFGFAYEPISKTVIRGAFGLYYNLIPSNYLQQGGFGNLPFVASQTFSQPNGATPLITMDAPFGGTGSFVANPTVAAQHSTVTPYTEAYNLAVERELPAGVSLRVGYVGQRNIHMNNTGGSGNTAPDINLPPPAPGTVQPRRPVQPFSTINLNFVPYFHSTMNALQVGVHKRYNHGLMVNAEYTWQRVLGVENFENPATIGDSYGNIGTNTPQVLSVSYSYELPFGKGQSLFGRANPFVDKLINGWQLSGITEHLSGQPFSVTYSAPGTPTGLVSGRANRVPGVPLYPQHKTIAQWFNPAAFTAPPNYTYGTSGYNMLWGPRYADWDMNLEKNTVWKERYRLKLRADAFNVFNHPNFSTPSAAVTNPSNIGKISSLLSENRTIEFGVKFTF